MSGYNRERKTFTLTAIKMEHYHRHHTHTAFPRTLCPVCHAQYGEEYMKPVAAFFRANGFDVVDIGDAHITISAPSKPRKKFGMWITKETDALYQLLAGRVDPLPGSLPHLPGAIDSDDAENAREALRDGSQEIESLMRLDSWLNDLKEHIHFNLNCLETRIKNVNAISENHSGNADREPCEQRKRAIMIKQAELAIVEQIQAKIKDFME